jgi:hypothetical protein
MLDAVGLVWTATILAYAVISIPFNSDNRSSAMVRRVRNSDAVSTGTGNGQTRADSAPSMLEPPSSLLGANSRPEIARASSVLPRPVSRAACPSESVVM